MLSVKSIQTKQTYLLWGLVATFVVIVLILVSIFISSPNRPQPKKSYKAPITTGTSRVNPQEVWVEKFTSEYDLQAKRIEALEKMLAQLLQMNQAAAPAQNILEKQASSQTNPVGAGVIERSTSAEELRQDLQQTLQKDGEYLNGHSLPLPPTDMAQIGGSQQTTKSSHHDQPKFHSKGIKKVSLSLSNSKANKPLKTNDNTIPAGAFAEAVLIGGVDASTSIQASGDPRPVLLRITNPGTLPRQFKSDLCGCHVLAASYGDISSERVFMRLEKLTCTERKTGEIVEINVQGYVAGEDGRAGLRGTVVDRAGESMRNAMVGGFLSGMGSFLGQARNPVTFSPMTGLAETNPLTNGDLLKHGASKGVSGALDKYADFYIKRAEQMQPVIQVAAGRTVDIVFTQGVAFDGSAMRGAISKVNDQRRFQEIGALETTSTDKPIDSWISQESDRKKGIKE